MWDGIEPGGEYEYISSDVERLTVLFPKLFLWLINIHLGYIVLVVDMGVVIEPYVPSQFSPQLDYD